MHQHGDAAKIVRADRPRPDDKNPRRPSWLIDISDRAPFVAVENAGGWGCAPVRVERATTRWRRVLCCCACLRRPRRHAIERWRRVSSDPSAELPLVAQIKDWLVLRAKSGRGRCRPLNFRRADDDELRADESRGDPLADLARAGLAPLSQTPTSWRPSLVAAAAQIAVDDEGHCTRDVDAGGAAPMPVAFHALAQSGGDERFG